MENLLAINILCHFLPRTDGFEEIKHQPQRHSFSTPFILFHFQLDDAALQIYKEGDYGTYLDLESSLAEQADDIDGLHSR